jgi:hypothetical protein
VKNYPASTTALPIITFAVYGFLVEAEWSKPLAGGVALLLGLAPYAVAKLTELRRR